MEHEHCRHIMGICFFFQAEDGIRDLVRSRGLGDVYKRQVEDHVHCFFTLKTTLSLSEVMKSVKAKSSKWVNDCLLYTSDAADERSSVDLGGRRIIKKKNKI